MKATRSQRRGYQLISTRWRVYAPVLFLSSTVITLLCGTNDHKSNTHMNDQGSASHCAISALNHSCDAPSILLAVMTFERPYSLQRLLKSLTAVNYSCATADLFISIDTTRKRGWGPAKLLARRDVVDISETHHWPHGSKFLMRRIKHAGLSQSWFELPSSTSHEYIAIFEDDMEVSMHFFHFFSLMHANSVLSDSGATGFCLHPNDWELPVQKECRDASFSRYLYMSPEPCNWGPVWKTSEWKKFLDWVTAMKDKGELPYVRNDIALNWNLYLDQGKDVQSSWVWKYNFLYNKLQVRYTFITCDPRFTKEVFFAINHKEPGEHFAVKHNVQNEPWRLDFNYSEVTKVMMHKHAFQPARFSGYRKNVKSLRSA